MSETCIPVLLPSMGEGVSEANVIKWLKKVGEKIGKDEPLIEISTDKVDTEVAAPIAGFLLAIHCEPGQTIQVEQIIAYVGSHPHIEAPKHHHEPPLQTPDTAATKTPLRERQIPAATSQSSTSLTTPPPFDPNKKFHGTVRSSPLVKKLAKEYRINLHEVPGTGLFGRITKPDIHAFLAHGGTRHAKAEENRSPSSRDQSSLKTTFNGSIELLEGVEVKRTKMSKIRQITARHMIDSVRTSPHVTTTFEIDLDGVNKDRLKNGKDFLDRTGIKLTYTSYFIAAAVAALQDVPELNASVDGDDILLKEQINIGCAVAIDTGLIVPVLKNLNKMSLENIAMTLDDIVQRARSKKLKPSDVQGGTFSITNPGMFGSLHSQPIINQPQVGIMSIGTIIQRPVACQKQADKVVIHPVAQIGITFDHRLVDGEGGAKFLSVVKSYLESF